LLPSAARSVRAVGVPDRRDLVFPAARSAAQLRHIRILNAIRIPQADLKVFVAARRAVTQRQ